MLASECIGVYNISILDDSHPRWAELCSLTSENFFYPYNRPLD